MTDPFRRVQAGRGEQKNKLNKEKKKIGQIKLIESSHSDVFLGGGANPTSPWAESAEKTLVSAGLSRIKKPRRSRKSNK